MPTLKLYCLPLGESMRSKFREEALAYPYGEALFVVPGRFLGNEIRKLGGVRSVIMDYLPNEILRLNNYAGDFVRISRTAQEMLLTSILEELTAKGQLTYFGKLTEKKGFVKNIVALISELARGAVSSEDLNAALSAWARSNNYGAKDQEIALIYQTYCARLQKSSFYDIDGLYRLALFILEQPEAIVPWQCLYFSEFYQFNALQLALIKRLSKYTSLQIGLFFDPQKPLLSEATRKAYEDLVGLGFSTAEESKPLTKRSASLQELVEVWKTNKVQALVSTDVHILKAYSLEQEMQLVLSKIKELILAGTPPETIICLVRSMEEYNGLSNKFRDYGVPTTLGNVTNFSGQKLPDFLLRLFRLALTPQEVSAWQDLFAHPWSEVLYDVQGTKLEESYNTHCFTSVKGLLTYVQNANAVQLDPLKDLVEALGKKFTAEELQNLLTAYLEKWDLLAKWGKDYQAGNCTLEELKILTKSQEEVVNLLDGFVVALEQSGGAKKKLGLEDFLAYWQESAPKILLTLEPGQVKGVTVEEVTNVQAVPFAHVFILGLREGSFPSIKQENWLYTDAERVQLKTLGIPLKIRATLLEQESYFFASALAMATQSLTLSYYEDDKAGASSYLEEVKRCFTPASLPELSWEVTVDNCLSKGELLALLAEHNNLDEKSAKWSTSYWGEDFALRKRLDVTRWEENSAANGNLARELLPRHLSSSALDAYLNCPFSYLLERIWGIKKWDPLTDEMQPLVKGILCHDVLAKFLGNYVQKNLNDYPSATLEEELTAIFNQCYEKLSAEGKIASGSYAPYERQNILDLLLTWLQKERAYQGHGTKLLPIALEQAFGREEVGSWPPLTLQAAGEEISFSGQIDRIDSDGTHYFVTDYKTGGNPSNSDMKEGRALQLPLYLLALQKQKELANENIMGAGYFSLKEGKRQNGTWQSTWQGVLPWYSKRMKSPFLEDVRLAAQKSIEACVQNLKAGHFPAQPSISCASYCPYTDVCRYRLQINSEEVADDE